MSLKARQAFECANKTLVFEGDFGLVGNWLRHNLPPRGIVSGLKVHHTDILSLCRGMKFVHTGKLDALVDNLRS